MFTLLISIACVAFGSGLVLETINVRILRDQISFLNGLKSAHESWEDAVKNWRTKCPEFDAMLAPGDADRAKWKVKVEEWERQDM